MPIFNRENSQNCVHYIIVILFHQTQIVINGDKHSLLKCRSAFFQLIVLFLNLLVHNEDTIYIAHSICFSLSMMIVACFNTPLSTERKFYCTTNRRKGHKYF